MAVQMAHWPSKFNMRRSCAILQGGFQLYVFQSGMPSSHLPFISPTTGLSTTQANPKEAVAWRAAGPANLHPRGSLATWSSLCQTHPRGGWNHRDSHLMKTESHGLLSTELAPWEITGKMATPDSLWHHMMPAHFSASFSALSYYVLITNWR